jgi:hypothetical protein
LLVLSFQFLILVVMQTKRKKNHADFQDTYRRSSNFRNVIKNEKFEISNKGVVKIVSET